MENNFKEGELVFAKENPSLLLSIRRFVNNIYYCRIVSNPQATELVYFDRDLFKGEQDKQALT